MGEVIYLDFGRSTGEESSAQEMPATYLDEIPRDQLVLMAANAIMAVGIAGRRVFHDYHNNEASSDLVALDHKKQQIASRLTDDELDQAMTLALDGLTRK